MLDDRIDAAYRYLAEHPESRCVASGGQNDNEPISEASCIRNTLVARGIHPDRIYLEDRSRSTEENLTFSAELIRKEGLPARVAIASDNFHQLRAAVWARRGGLDPWSIGCVTWWPLSPGYWAREAAAVTVLGIRTETGVIASGDQFISSSERKDAIVKTFGAIACEMEGAAIAQVAWANGVPCAIVRAISDKADGSSSMDYPTFEAQAARNSAALVIAMLKRQG